MTALTLREILAFDVLGPAAPVLLAGRAALDRPVRWVRSSEVYEGYAFLYGGELLLTNGFGLAHTSAGQQRTYIRELAARGVAAVFIEIGRALATMPEAVVAESELRGLPLVALRRVVPFVRIAEAVNTAIVSLSLAERTTRRYRDTAHTASGTDRSAHSAALLADLADAAPVGRAEAAARAELAGVPPDTGPSVGGPRGPRSAGSDAPSAGALPGRFRAHGRAARRDARSPPSATGPGRRQGRDGCAAGGGAR
ncbi:PucR family transcriptional regulator ligand-binding domain-containing protein [Kitasatospora sp. NPDC050463]|uniref:PucR family transcriptional regulator ligand-binding domain-containing protein n=1 Tax=Kitasatospora sp. NPDC050463 TaxID=3155786 RepID=UPI003403EAC2